MRSLTSSGWVCRGPDRQPQLIRLRLRLFAGGDKAEFQELHEAYAAQLGTNERDFWCGE